MRKALVILSLPILVILLGFTLIALLPMPASASPVREDSTSLPACTYEDGSGQMLCLWDASESGNGEGMDAVGGDCSLATTGTVEASMACMVLWPMGERTTYMSDGSVSVTSKGSVLVDDCLTVDYRVSLGEIESEGWELQECFLAFIEE